MTTEPKRGLKEIVTMSEQKDAPVNHPDEPWETITAYGNVEDMTLHPILRRAYRVACLIERAPHASIEQTTASSAAFSLVEELYLSISALIGKELLSRSKAAAYDILITDKPHGNDCNVSVRGHSEADALIAAKDAEIASAVACLREIEGMGTAQGKLARDWLREHWL